MPITPKRLLWLLPLLIMLGAGCDRAWQGYGEIELGQSLPTDGVLARDGTDQPFGRARGERTTVNLPPILVFHCLSAMTDPGGRATAKSYGVGVMGFAGLAWWFSVDQTMEVLVPPASLSDPPPDWRMPESGASKRAAELQEWVRPLVTEVVGEGAPWRFVGPQAGERGNSGEDAASLGAFVIPSRIKPEVLARLTEPGGYVEVDLARDLDLSNLKHGQDVAKVTPTGRLYLGHDGRYFLEVVVRMPRPPAANALECLLQAYEFLPPAPQDMEFHGLDRISFGNFFGIAMMAMSGTPRLGDVTDQLPHLAGLSKDGFDWTYAGREGGTIRIRNLGGGRLRVDVRAFGLYDPLFLAVVFRNLCGDTKKD